MQSIALEISKLCYNYRSDFLTKNISALKQINLSVMQGEAFGFLGHNGAGKTTTIKCILGLIKAKSGQIKIFGETNQKIEQRKLIGYLPEQPYFYDHLSVFETLQMYAHLSGVDKKIMDCRIKETVELVQMQHKINASMRSLSKGLTQRVALAQAIIAKPKLLILDEPFSGLDPIGRKEFRDIFLNLKANGCTLFMSSHILSDVEFICDRVSIMSKGQIKGIFDVANIPSLFNGVYELVVRDYQDCETALKSKAEQVSYDKTFMRLSFKQRSHAEVALKFALENSIPIERFEFVQGNLEDLFVNLVQQDNNPNYNSDLKMIENDLENDRLKNPTIFNPQEHRHE